VQTSIKAENDIDYKEADIRGLLEKIYKIVQINAKTETDINFNELLKKIDIELENINEELSHVDKTVDNDMDNIIKTYLSVFKGKSEQIKTKIERHRSQLKKVRTSCKRETVE
jgi:uncharacterized protein YukE